MRAYYALYSLSILKLEQGQLVDALKDCKQAVWGIRRAQGNMNRPYHIVLSFLAYSHDALGNLVEEARISSFVHEACISQTSC